MTTALKEIYAGGSKLNDEPGIFIFEDFLSDLEIVHLLQSAGPGLARARVSAARTGVISEGRTGRNCWIPHNRDAVIQRLADRVAALVGLPLANAESLQVVHYGEGHEYAPHFDAWDAGTERGQRCMARGGQRLVTCLMYLNDVPEGGATCFPELALDIRARKRCMLLFHNCHQGGATRHPGSLHGGSPVLAGEKWACNFWFRERAYQQAAV